MIRGLEISVSPSELLGDERDWRLNQLPVVNDLINQAFVMKPLKQPTRVGFGELPC